MEIMKVTKREGFLEDFNPQRVKDAIIAAFKESDVEYDRFVIDGIYRDISFWDNMHIEDIQDQIVEVLNDWGYENVAIEFLFYRWSHEKYR